MFIAYWYYPRSSPQQRGHRNESVEAGEYAVHSKSPANTSGAGPEFGFQFVKAVNTSAGIDIFFKVGNLRKAMTWSKPSKYGSTISLTPGELYR
jgi:hypothetical protein